MKKFNFVETTSTHVYDVITNASEVTLSEIKNTESTKWKLMKDTVALLPKSQTVTLRLGEQNLLVFGHTATQAKNTRVTWFVAKQKYFDLGVRGVLIARNHLRTVSKLWPNTMFESFSFSSHKDCQRWFELIGFTRYIPYHNIPPACRVFRLETGKLGEVKKIDLADVS